MIRFNNDYNHGAFESILNGLAATNTASYAGYGEDEWCARAEDDIKKLISRDDALIKFIPGATQANIVVISAALSQIQSVIAADTGHINCHEAASIEGAGHKILVLPNTDGKITAAPADARMDAEVMVGGSGKGDHPSFMALTLASDALKEIGFNLIVSDMSNFAEMTNAINAGTADMFAMAWQATPDPDMFQIYHSKGGSNEKSYWIKDADLDELIMMARQSTDQTYRKTLYKQCLDIVADWAVEIPIYQRQNCVIFSAKRVNLDTVTPDITTYWTWYNDIELLDLQ